jgi:hypothetical protein
MSASHIDRFGQTLTGSPESVSAWRHAYDEMLGFVGDPFVTLAAANAADDSFVMGPTFCVAYSILGGTRLDAPAVLVDLERARRRSEAATERERRHVEAVLALHAGEFFNAAVLWHAITRDFAEDFTAYRLVHDVCLHIGDDSIRLPSAQRAVQVFGNDSFTSGRSHGLLAFALEEVGRYDEAEHHGLRSIAIDETDVWGRHALAHVYESIDNTEALTNLLLPTSHVWIAQTGLSNHVWWHVGLRQLHAGDASAALNVFDRHMVSTTAFGLADATSLLWRTDLVGAAPSVPHWAQLADRWASNQQRHACGFLDMHAAMAFAKVDEHNESEVFWGELDRAHRDGETFNDITFRETVKPLASGLRAFAAGAWSEAAEKLASVEATLPRVGGSVVQRDIVARTISHATHGRTVDST